MRGAFETDESFCIGRGNSPSSPPLAFGVEMYLFHFSIAHRKLRLPIVRQTPPNASMLALIWSPYHSFNFKNRHKNSSRLLFQFGRLWDGRNTDNCPRSRCHPRFHELGKSFPKNRMPRLERRRRRQAGLCVARQSDTYFILLTNRAYNLGCMNECMYVCMVGGVIIMAHGKSFVE